MMINICIALGIYVAGAITGKHVWNKFMKLVSKVYGKFN